MIFLTLMAFLIAFVFMAYAIYYAAKLNSTVKPKKEKLMQFVPFLLLLKSSHTEEGEIYLLRFYVLLILSLLLMLFVAVNS